MKHINIVFEDIKIPFYYSSKIDHNFFENITQKINSKVAIITDDNVKNLYVNQLIKNLGLNNKNSLILSSPAGEKYKSVEIIFSYIKKLNEWGFDRSCLVICLGGGIAGNTGGLIAGLMYRGINFIHIPTTILAAFDSVLSLKQAVNSDYAKNAIGLYHKPMAIYSSLKFFNTLSMKEIRSGLCETAKNALCILPSAISDLNERLIDAMNLDERAMELVKDISIKSKQEVMINDKLEKKRALVLEYGHTIGHAIELIDAFKRQDSISHGEAVGVGMLVEAEISHEMGFLNKNDLHSHYELLAKLDIIQRLPTKISIDEVIKFTKKDNKRGYIKAHEDEVGIILLEGLGKVHGNQDLPITPVPLKIIEKVLKKFVI
jgi:3-dehydroquinate synthetase